MFSHISIFWLKVFECMGVHHRFISTFYINLLLSLKVLQQIKMNTYEVLDNDQLVVRPILKFHLTILMKSVKQKIRSRATVRNPWQISKSTSIKVCSTSGIVQFGTIPFKLTLGALWGKARKEKLNCFKLFSPTSGHSATI